jgi:hypothetical protein
MRSSTNISDRLARHRTGPEQNEPAHVSIREPHLLAFVLKALALALGLHGRRGHRGKLGQETGQFDIGRLPGLVEAQFAAGSPEGLPVDDDGGCQLRLALSWR